MKSIFFITLLLIFCSCASPKGVQIEDFPSTTIQERMVIIEQLKFSNVISIHKYTKGSPELGESVDPRVLFNNIDTVLLKKEFKKLEILKRCRVEQEMVPSNYYYAAKINLSGSFDDSYLLKEGNSSVCTELFKNQIDAVLSKSRILNEEFFNMEIAIEFKLRSL